ncbi:MAG: hypothetical protein ACTSO9_16945, partial [Candidatus Helarchaeota archaeon]
MKKVLGKEIEKSKERMEKMNKKDIKYIIEKLKSEKLRNRYSIINTLEWNDDYKYQLINFLNLELFKSSDVDVILLLIKFFKIKEATTFLEDIIKYDKYSYNHQKISIKLLKKFLSENQLKIVFKNILNTNKRIEEKNLQLILQLVKFPADFLMDLLISYEQYNLKKIVLENLIDKEKLVTIDKEKLEKIILKEIKWEINKLNKITENSILFASFISIFKYNEKEKLNKKNEELRYIIREIRDIIPRVRNLNRNINHLKYLEHILGILNKKYIKTDIFDVIDIKLKGFDLEKIELLYQNIKDLKKLPEFNEFNKKIMHFEEVHREINYNILNIKNKMELIDDRISQVIDLNREIPKFKLVFDQIKNFNKEIPKYKQFFNQIEDLNKEISQIRPVINQVIKSNEDHKREEEEF